MQNEGFHRSELSFLVKKLVFLQRWPTGLQTGRDTLRPGLWYVGQLGVASFDILALNSNPGISPTPLPLPNQ